MRHHNPSPCSLGIVPQGLSSVLRLFVSVRAASTTCLDLRLAVSYLIAYCPFRVSLYNLHSTLTLGVASAVLCALVPCLRRHLGLGLRRISVGVFKVEILAFAGCMG